MPFRDRIHAGQLLAQRLMQYANRDDVLVLAVPRGGVPVGFEVAQALHAPLEVFVLRKLGVPWQEELAFGAVASGGVRVVEQETIDALGLTSEEIEAVVEREQSELRRRERAYRDDRPAPHVQGKTVLLVDDGIATGSSMLAAIAALRQLKPAKIVVAVPVAAASTTKRLRKIADEFVAVEAPATFYAVGQFYADFQPTSDEEVVNLLERASAAPARV
jgi:putative phosphoribosyl transferase